MLHRPIKDCDFKTRYRQEHVLSDVRLACVRNYKQIKQLSYEIVVRMWHRKQILHSCLSVGDL